MRKISLGAAVVALVGLASPAAAADWSVCGGTSNGFTACSSATASVSGTTLTVTVNNLFPAEGDEHLITGFGFYYSGSLGTAALTSPPTGWANGLGSLQSPGPDGSWTWLGGASTTNGVNQAIGWNSSQQFTFTLSQALTEQQLAGMQFAFRTQSTGPDGAGSMKCYPSDNIESEHACSDIPVTTVPEPATLALLGSGLFGLAGIGAVRRRRGNAAV